MKPENLINPKLLYSPQEYFDYGKWAPLDDDSDMYSNYKPKSSPKNQTSRMFATKKVEHFGQASSPFFMQPQIFDFGYGLVSDFYQNQAPVMFDKSRFLLEEKEEIFEFEQNLTDKRYYIDPPVPPDIKQNQFNAPFRVYFLCKDRCLLHKRLKKG